MIRRINIHGGPGSGKTNVALWLTSTLDAQGFGACYVGEWCKRWSWEKRRIDGFDQLTIFANQLAAEDTLLRNGARLVVSDCPLLTCCSYADRQLGPEIAASFVEIARRFGTMYRSIDLLLDRDKNIEYSPLGRYQTEKQSGEISTHVHDFVCNALGEPLPIYTAKDEKLLGNIILALN